eukprot:gnl/MRDRNA2_/MRDRNA2_87127_c0_seq1.p1 gnl/MRDRNA2_/MRDRNA2_87127_c0~~gnl/MRDRNA2_/MRDRNA2_87127_c0_seq1.p1  ORF type:complete len:218 (+),score=47.67 gnl/MRDRNA2_/MRDRNA2_87127_c0_seq1:83-736(+)
MAPLSSRSCSQTHPASLCGEWKYEYKLPYSPYGNQSLQETYLLLSCGVAYKSMIDKYDEGKDYFSERRTSGWGRWFVRPNGKLIILCDTVTSTSVGGTVCGTVGPCKDVEHYAGRQEKVRVSCEDFVTKHLRQKAFDDIDEEKLRAQMRQALQNLPANSLISETEEDESEEEEEHQKAQQDCRSTEAQNANSPCVSQQKGALSSLRRMFARSKRQRL